MLVADDSFYTVMELDDARINLTNEQILEKFFDATTNEQIFESEIKNIRFFNIAKKLPMEMRMHVCIVAKALNKLPQHRTFNSMAISDELIKRETRDIICIVNSLSMLVTTFIFYLITVDVLNTMESFHDLHQALMETQ
jgi:hypothetical protein